MTGTREVAPGPSPPRPTSSLEIWESRNLETQKSRNLEIWRSWMQTIKTKHCIIMMKIHHPSNVSRVLIGRETTLTLQLQLSVFAHGPQKPHYFCDFACLFSFMVQEASTFLWCSFNASGMREVAPGVVAAIGVEPEPGAGHGAAEGARTGSGPATTAASGELTVHACLRYTFAEELGTARSRGARRGTGDADGTSAVHGSREKVQSLQ